MPAAPPSPGVAGARPADNAQFLRKQRAAIEVIAADNMKLKEEVMLENKFSVNPTTQTAAALIANLQGQADVYAAKITEEQRLKAELEHRVEVLKQRIAMQRAQMGGINNSAEKAIKIQRRIRILEDRLQQASVRYNEAQTRSRALRARIDGLRRERLLFEELAAKLTRGLARRKSEMVELIVRIAQSHEAREKALILQGQVKAQADKDVLNYEAEWRQLTDIVEQDRRRREAQRARDIAAREEQMAQLFGQEFSVKRRSAQRSTGGKAGEPAAATQTADTNDGDAAATAAASAPERVKELKAALGKVLEATGSEDADELLAQLVEGEENNFRMFSYLNDLTAEVDKLDDGIGALRREVERCRAEAAAAANDDATQKLRALTAELSAVEEEAEGYESKHGQAMAAINSLRAAVLDMFNRSGCATPAVLELLGESGEGVTEKNLMQYLGVLEQRINELLAHYCELALEGSDAAAGERAAAVLTGKSSASAPLQFVIEPPTTGAVGPSGGAGSLAGSRTGTSGGGLGALVSGAPPAAAAAAGTVDDERPLSRGSLAARVQKSVAAKAETAVKIKAVRPHRLTGR